MLDVWLKKLLVFHCRKLLVLLCRLHMVQVGETLHPATADHHINWIVIKTNMGLYLRKFAHDELPEATVTLARGECVKEIYSFCNIHGLWLAGEEESF